MVVPFIRGSGLHREIAYDQVHTLTAVQQDIAPIEVPAYGYMRSLLIEVTGTAGAGTGATLVEDGPFNALLNLQLQQPNGFPFYQVSSGYSSYLIDKYGGYRFRQDAKSRDGYTYTAGGGTAPNLSFKMRIPVELNIRDALGVLPNKNAAAPFKFKFSLNTLANVFGGSPTTPSLRVRIILEAWDQPPESLNGQGVQGVPPAMNTIQYWTEQPINVNAGQFSPRLTRMGNYLRMIIPVLRRAGTSRANGDTDWPDPVTIMIDQRNQDAIYKSIWRNDVYEKWGYTGTADAAEARDNGVYPYDWAHEFDGKVGHENRDLWLPTLEATRFEFSGSWGNAGTMTVLTNDVAPQGNVFL
jgi:hypothetical protein